MACLAGPAALGALRIILGRIRRRIGVLFKRRVRLRQQIAAVIGRVQRPMGARANRAAMVVFHLLVGKSSSDNPRITYDQDDNRRRDDQEYQHSHTRVLERRTPILACRKPECITLGGRDLTAMRRLSTAL
jgi:hypothetical protein